MAAYDPEGAMEPGDSPAEDRGESAPPGLGAKPYDIHKCAMDAEKALEKLATELGKADADPKVIKAISGYADDMRKLASAYTKLMQHTQPPAQPAPRGQAGINAATDQLAADVRQA